jgi:hypothetical protein
VNQASFSAIKSLITAAADFEDLTTVPVACTVTDAPDRLKASFSTTVEEEVVEPTEVTELAILFPLRKIFKKPNIRESGAGIASTFCVFVAAMDVIYKLNYQ